MKPIAQNATSPLWETNDRFEQGLGKSTASSKFFDQYMVASKATDSEGPIICRLGEALREPATANSVVEATNRTQESSGADESDSLEDVQASAAELGQVENFESDIDDSVASGEVAEPVTEILGSAVGAQELSPADEGSVEASGAETAAVANVAEESGKRQSISSSEGQVDESGMGSMPTRQDYNSHSRDDLVESPQSVVEAVEEDQHQPSEGEIASEAEAFIEKEGVEATRSTKEHLEVVQIQDSSKLDVSAEKFTPSSSLKESLELQQANGQGHAESTDVLVSMDETEVQSADSKDLNASTQVSKSAVATAQVADSIESAGVEASVTAEPVSGQQQAEAIEHESGRWADELTPAAERMSVAEETAVDDTAAKPGESKHHIRLNSMQQQRMLQRVTKAFELAQQRGGEIRLRLSPPALGSLKVELKFEGQQMSARLEAEHSQARQLILEHLPALRDRLAEQGISIETFEVDLYHDQSGDAQFADREAARDDSQSGYSIPTVSEATSEESGKETESILEDRSLNIIV
jgi:flagellar hook-length control protein FliK